MQRDTCTVDSCSDEAYSGSSTVVANDGVNFNVSKISLLCFECQDSFRNSKFRLGFYINGTCTVISRTSSILKDSKDVYVIIQEIIRQPGEIFGSTNTLRLLSSVVILSNRCNAIVFKTVLILNVGVNGFYCSSLSTHRNRNVIFGMLVFLWIPEFDHAVSLTIVISM